MPARVLFEKRQWPEGYEFPACIRCNRTTRHDEQVVALISRLQPDVATKVAHAEFDALFKAVARNYPEVLVEMYPTQEQVRRGVEKYRLAVPQGLTPSDLPLLSVAGPKVNRAIENFALKLFCALYYHHSTIVLGLNGGVAIRWYTNLQIDNEEIPRELASVTNRFPRLIRSTQPLKDQFFYRWGITDDKKIAAFVVFFRKAFAIVGYVNQDAAQMGLPEGARILRPHEWT